MCISNNGIRKLKIKNKAPSASKIPSYLFSYLELTHMKLTNCILKPPLSFHGFYNLVIVELVDVIITIDLSFGTQLGTLDFYGCSGIEHICSQLKCNKNLTDLSIFRCRGLECSIDSIRKEDYRVAKKIMDIDKLFDKISRINVLDLDGIFLKSEYPTICLAFQPYVSNFNTLFNV